MGLKIKCFIAVGLGDEGVDIIYWVGLRFESEGDLMISWLVLKYIHSIYKVGAAGDKIWSCWVEVEICSAVRNVVLEYQQKIPSIAGIRIASIIQFKLLNSSEHRSLYFCILMFSLKILCPEWGCRIRIASGWCRISLMRCYQDSRSSQDPEHQGCSQGCIGIATLTRCVQARAQRCTSS